MNKEHKDTLAELVAQHEQNVETIAEITKQIFPEGPPMRLLMGRWDVLESVRVESKRVSIVLVNGVEMARLDALAHVAVLEMDNHILRDIIAVHATPRGGAEEPHKQGERP